MTPTKSDPKVVGVMFYIVGSTDKAYLVATNDGNFWMPKRSCHGLYWDENAKVTVVNYVDFWIIAKSNLWRLTDKKVRRASTILSR